MSTSLRAYVTDRFHKKETGKSILVSCVSFGFRQGVPEDADLMFDVRFLPNPHFVPEFRPLTGRHPKVAKYIRSFPQTRNSSSGFPRCWYIFCRTTFAKAKAI